MASKRFVLYFQDEDNTICGSDQYIPLDARCNIDIQIENLKTNSNNYFRIKQGIIGFRICTGTIANPKYLTELIKIV